MMDKEKNTRKKLSKRHLYGKVLSVGLLLSVVVCLCSFFFRNTESSASSCSNYRKCYKSIEVQPGDSLWSLSEEYYTDDWKDVRSFMKEIKSFNGIENDIVHAGNYIAIPYYVLVDN